MYPAFWKHQKVRKYVVRKYVLPSFDGCSWGHRRTAQEIFLLRAGNFPARSGRRGKKGMKGMKEMKEMKRNEEKWCLAQRVQDFFAKMGWKIPPKNTGFWAFCVQEPKSLCTFATWKHRARERMKIEGRDVSASEPDDDKSLNSQSINH